ncbi:PLDc_N domain-containing protein [Nocardioides piscis]|uniref:PLDc_N domain-containing protein n=2 Tax=Nocardioides piscis TaxID=2714938 RepID=A0A6G7YKL3_9ACTN|nr:PLDc_N domain-containing protein [Nocardioides piscis]
MSVVSIVLMVWCLIEAISTDEGRIRNLPKLWWILLILFFPLAGSIAWLVAGRPATTGPRPGSTPAFPEYDRPGRMAANDPAKDEDFLKKVRERAEEQRRRHEQQKRRQAEQDGAGDADAID